MNKIPLYSRIILLWLAIALFGSVMIYSSLSTSTVANDASQYTVLIAQWAYILIILSALIFILLTSRRINLYKILNKITYPLFFATLICLLVVLGLGDLSKRGGARSVIPLGIIDFQPLELFKIAVILFLAKKMSTVKYNSTFKELLKMLYLPALGIGLIALQPDLGGAIISAAVIGMIFVLNGQYVMQMLQYGVLTIGGVILSLPILLQSYQSARFSTWINPFIDPKESGFQPIMSYVAISNGGLLGVGLFNSTQKTRNLTQADTDFIFSIICEELGIIGALFVIVSLMGLAYLIIKVGKRAKDRFGMLYCYGFAMLIVAQTFINIGGVTGVIPMTGVTLPFISRGVNSFMFLSIGILITVIVEKNNLKERKIEEKRNEQFFSDTFGKY
ncbi:MAG: FtsW/RodA/SpoVE family cell cycle protein [Mycoplasmatales bacterium]